MGAWGTGVFENDWALDWVAELSRSGDADFPASALREFDGGLLESWECATALAAAEAVAASSGESPADLPDGVRMWLERTGARADAEEIQLALRVVDLILDQNSELRNQHDETGASLAEWLTPIENLQRRLGAVEPAPAGAGRDAVPSPSRRLHDLVARRDPSGSWSLAGAPGAEYTWRKERSSVLFAVRDARGLGVTLDTRWGGRRRGPGSPAGLRWHAPLYLWGNETGDWPDHFTVRTTCPVYEEYHWDDVAETGTSVDLVNRWLAADGDDEVIWAVLDREYGELARKFEALVLVRRARLLPRLEEQGRTEDASRLASWDLPKLAAWLAAGEKKRIAEEHDRRTERSKRYRRRIAEIDARHAGRQDPE
jgi:hypothetical protein